MTPEELAAQEAAEKAQKEAEEKSAQESEKAKKEAEKADKKAKKEAKVQAQKEADEDDDEEESTPSPYKVYDEYKVDILRDGDGKVSFEKGKKLRENVKLEPFRAEILNNQSINTKTRFYEQQ